MIRITDEFTDQFTEQFPEHRDRELEQRVRNYLHGHHIPALRRLDVTAQSGTVTLQGSVTTYYEKQLSQQCSRRVAGIRQLVDNVVVRQPHAARPANHGEEV